MDIWAKQINEKRKKNWKNKKRKEQPYSLWASSVGKKTRKREEKGCSPHTPKIIHPSFFSN